MSGLERVDGPRLDTLADGARGRPRRRLNDNLHATPDDPVQRLFIAMEPGSYVRPHRHRPDRFELFVGVRGRLVVLTFDDAGRVLTRDEVTPGGAADSLAAAEIRGGTWHTVIALEPGSTFLEVKQGPYAPLPDKDFAAWAPAEDTPEATALAVWLTTAHPGDRAPVF